MKRHRGLTLIEVVITMFILAVGLLGLAGLQATAHNGEVESVSRGQALLLANDLADRMAANLSDVKASTTAGSGYNQQDGANVKTVFGTGYANDCINATNTTSQLQAACCAAKVGGAARDLCEWDLALKGISVAVASSKLGGMSEARGCVFRQTANVFEIDVVWKGRMQGAMATDMTCASSAIASRRQGVSRRIRVAELGAL